MPANHKLRDSQLAKRWCVRNAEVSGFISTERGTPLQFVLQFWYLQVVLKDLNVDCDTTFCEARNNRRYLLSRSNLFRRWCLRPCRCCPKNCKSNYHGRPQMRPILDTDQGCAPNAGGSVLHRIWEDY